MSSYRFRPRALRELAKIRAYLLQENPVAAFNTVKRILDACQMLADYPHNGHASGTSGTYREYPVKPYLIQFCPIRRGVEITRIEDGRRNPKRRFR